MRRVPDEEGISFIAGFMHMMVYMYDKTMVSDSNSKVAVAFLLEITTTF